MLRKFQNNNVHEYGLRYTFLLNRNFSLLEFQVVLLGNTDVIHSGSMLMCSKKKKKKKNWCIYFRVSPNYFYIIVIMYLHLILLFGKIDISI